MEKQVRPGKAGTKQSPFGKVFFFFKVLNVCSGTKSRREQNGEGSIPVSLNIT